MFAGKKRMGQRGRRERVSLYFSTSCLFSCSVLIVRGGMKCTLVVCSIESGCESHIWFGNLGLEICGLLVTVFVKMSTRAVIVIPGMRASCELFYFF